LPVIDSTAPGLRIGELASRSGVAVGTLRMWEARYGFPAPVRLPSGHRRYGEADLERVRAVARHRAGGLPLAVAIERARGLAGDPRPSVYGALRERFPHLHPARVGKPLLIRLSAAIEDECCARAPRPLLFACFQHEHFYRAVQGRWQSFARTAEHAFVMAEFPGGIRPDARPVEIPLAGDDPLVREWVLACDAPELSACLAAWERPGPPDAVRSFEAIWTVEPVVAREAARLCCELAARADPELVTGARERLAGRAPAPDEDYLRATVELATRAALYAARPA
jgi:DICT domain-containing protein